MFGLSKKTATVDLAQKRKDEYEADRTNIEEELQYYREIVPLLNRNVAAQYTEINGSELINRLWCYRDNGYTPQEAADDLNLKGDRRQKINQILAGFVPPTEKS